jgi:hypothetical protein
VLKEDNEELKSERDDLEKANIGAQKLVTKLKVEKASWQKKYLNLLEGNKRPREEESDTSDAKRRSESNSSSTSLNNLSNTLEEDSSNTLLDQSSSSSARASTHTLLRNTLENDTSSNSRASATRSAGQHIISQASSRRHTSTSTSAHSDLSRVVEMNEQGKRAVRADLDLDFDPWDPQISRWEKRLVILALWKREVRRYQRYVPDYSDQKTVSHRTSHDGDIRVGMRTVKDFVHRSQNWSYEEGTSDLHDEFHKYHLRNYVKDKKERAHKRVLLPLVR